VNPGDRIADVDGSSKMNKKVKGVSSTNRENKSSSFSATSQSAQKALRQMLKKTSELRKSAEEYNSALNSKVPSNTKHAIETIGIPFMVSLSNLVQYVLLMSHDLICLFEEMVCTRSRWKKKLFARHVAITLYECMNDFEFLLGKPFREQLIRIRLPALDTARKAIHKEIIMFEKSHGAYLKKVRNSVIGHRDHNAETQIELIKSLKPSHIYRLSSKFLRWQHKFWNLLLHPLVKELNDRLARVSKIMTNDVSKTDDKLRSSKT